MAERVAEQYKTRVREIDHEVREVAVELDEGRVVIRLDYRGVRDVLGPVTGGRAVTRAGAIGAVLRAEEPGLDIVVDVVAGPLR